ncbi:MULTISPECIES: putative quinol monooxygenase [Exiguobacterium]|uniref:putative quinol monooxygenase n=1 Tax=Exiguobacterium TaxID=33986 RepID=UPI001BED048A|nr:MULTISPECIES: antibiotic biosynthesis monooxygenase [Exiguobacterium]MCT4784376.1 antibiotic biosynthesis monooxygenase [Exiguobacterium himgiriensis]
MAYGLIGKLTAIQGERETLLSILLEAAEAMEQEAACEAYRVSASLDDDAIIVYEVWESSEAHQQSLMLPATKQLINQAKPILTGVERIATFEPKGKH